MKSRTSKIIISFVVVLFVVKANAQVKLNALSIEIAKTGLIYNLTYDRRLNKNTGVRLSAGSNFGNYLEAFMTGGGAYYLMGKEKSFFEAGADIYYLEIYEVSDDQRSFALVYPDYTVKTFYTAVNLGYRKYGKATLFRIGVSPGFIKTGFVPGGYISYGFSF